MYSINFPDFEACFTQGENLQDGLDMANDVLCLTLYDLEESSSEIPKPSNPLEIRADKNEFVTLVSCDTLVFRRICFPIFQ